MSTIIRIAHALGTTCVALCADPPAPTEEGVPVELPLGGPDGMDGGDGMEQWNAETAPIPRPRRRRVRRAPGSSRVRRWLRALGRFLSLARA